MQAHGIMLGDPLGPRGLGYATIESNAGAIGSIAITGASRTSGVAQVAYQLWP